MDLCVGQFVDMKGMNALNRVKGLKEFPWLFFTRKRSDLKSMNANSPLVQADLLLSALSLLGLPVVLEVPE